MAENGDMARSIMTVIEAVDRLIGNFLSDPAAALKPVIIGCQPLGRQLDGALRDFGWDGASFARPPDLRALSSRLRAMLYSGLEQKGQGSFSLVYKVGQGRLSLASIRDALRYTPRSPHVSSYLRAYSVKHQRWHWFPGSLARSGCTKAKRWFLLLRRHGIESPEISSH